MKVLVTVASRHGSTSLIGDAIREELAATGVKAHLIDPELVTDISEYDAVVLGSAVYAGRWLKPARAFAKRFDAALTRKPVWLFSSGPVGEPPTPTRPAAEALELAQRLGARDHHVFEGRIERDLLGLGERFRIANLPSGDFRPWVAITVWTRRIAASLKSEIEPAAARGR